MASACFGSLWCSFNSRSREGSDVHVVEGFVFRRQFQFALPRGERPVCCAEGAGITMVSIRAPARGATVVVAVRFLLVTVSIRAPARGATLSPSGGARVAPVSIRAPARGATSAPLPSSNSATVSIRAPARGATPGGRHPRAFGQFQFALPRGERQREL